MVASADYLGLGVSQGLHPYYHADSAASATLDYLRSVRQFTDAQDIPLTDELFLTGYSQGAHVTMALHRALEQEPTRDWNLIASAPMAGAFDLADLSFPAALTAPAPSSALYVAYILLAFDRVHDIFSAPAEVFQAPHDAQVEALFDGTRDTFPLNSSGDAEGCTLDSGTHEVRTPKGYKQAYAKYVEGGWPSLTADPAYGGQGLPVVLNQCFFEMLNSANQAWTMYPGLSHGAYAALHEHGTPEQKALYLPKMVSGEWTGTMCLTEPHCGTDLGLMCTKAEPQADGTYKITGNKIFISADEHDMTANIVHLVLARLPDGPSAG